MTNMLTIISTQCTVDSVLKKKEIARQNIIVLQATSSLASTIYDEISTNIAKRDIINKFLPYFHLMIFVFAEKPLLIH